MPPHFMTVESYMCAGGVGVGQDWARTLGYVAGGQGQVDPTLQVPRALQITWLKAKDGLVLPHLADNKLDLAMPVRSPSEGGVGE